MPGTEQAASSPAATARVDEILRAACRVVVAGGASDLRIGSVAQEAGVSRTLVHYYFTTRQELLRATFAYAEDLRVVLLALEPPQQLEVGLHALAALELRLRGLLVVPEPRLGHPLLERLELAHQLTFLKDSRGCPRPSR